MLEVKDKQELRVKRSHIQLMKHPETALYSGVMLMGKSEVVDGSFTAYTDGVNKRYCRSYLKDRVQSDAKLRGLILHENLQDRKSTRLNSSHVSESRMPSSA